VSSELAKYNLDLVAVQVGVEGGSQTVDNYIFSMEMEELTITKG
jgi:hypothetical protein